MPTPQPQVSAIVPVFNGEAFLAEAVDSIRQQSVHVLEIIIVDDGSTDRTAEIIARLDGPIRAVRQPNRGPAAARARALRMARGAVIGFLDADDLWPEHKLEIQLAHLARHPSLGVVLGRTQHVRRVPDDSGGVQHELGGEAWTTLMFGAALIRASAFEIVGLPDESFRYDDDVDWFLRANETGVGILTHPEVSVYYRRHTGNLTNQRATDQRFFLRALKQSLDRRRRINDGVVAPLTRWFDEDAVRR